MNNIFKKVGALLRQTWVWTLLSVLFLALSIWLAGPLLAVDDHKFWEGSAARLLTISMLFLMWGVAMVFVSWRSSQRKQAEEALKNGRDRTLGDEKINNERKALKARFKDARKIFGTLRLYRDRGERQRGELPWYLLIGPQGSGKTSVLNSSGLEFARNTVERDLPEESPDTRYCDWYLADQGVIIETPGRYLTHPDVFVDSSGWNLLLDLLHKERRHRPLNGVLVTIPTQALLPEGTAALDALAKQVNLRLREMRQTLHVDLPVYLVLTKADELPGFTEFFDQLTLDENEQVLGVTLEKERHASESKGMRAEFEGLLQHLNSQVLLRMHHEREIRSRGLIFDFPYQLALIGTGLGRFVELAFGDSRYQRVGQLRGFYLTSAPPSAEVLDRTAADNRSINVKCPRFIQQVLTRVIFPEAEMADLDKHERRRIDWGQRALYLGALATLSLFGLLWSHSFSANEERLQSLRFLAQDWNKQRSSLTARDDALAVLRPLDTAYAATQVFPLKEDAALRERGGLYQGEGVSPTLGMAYERELETQLLPRVVASLEGQIRSNMKNRDLLLKTLRAYLMLSMPDRRDAVWLKDWMAADWSLRYAGNSAVQNGLSAHFERLLQQSFNFLPNEQLVTQARKALRGESLASVVYRVLQEQASHLPDYRFSQHLGPQSLQLFGTDYVIPGFYTRQGYQQFFSMQGTALVADILNENWVLGEGSSISEMDMRRLMVELEQLYFRDYANYWGEAIGQVALPPINSAQEGADQLANLTSANSPLLHLLAQLRENTQFPTFGEGVEVLAGAAEKVSMEGGQLGQLAAAGSAKMANIAKSKSDTARQSLQRRFEPLHRLLDQNNGPAADLTPALNALNELQLQLASVARDSAPEQAAFEIAISRMNGQSDALSHSRQAAGRLPRPLNVWFGRVTEDSWRLLLSDTYQFLNQRYHSELYSVYGKTISKRYPFDAHSTSDVAINDFRDFFKAEGVVEGFFDRYMRPFVSGDPGSYRLRKIDGQTLPVSRVYLEQMANAQVIRKSFFAINPLEPHVQFKLEPYTLDPTVSRTEFTFGDRTIEYRHGPIVPVSFAWPTDAEDGRTSLVMEKMVGRPIGIEKNTGPWSLFRLFDLMQIEYLSGREVMVLKADVGGLRANYLLTSRNTPSPFDLDALRSFRMPMQL